MEKNKIIFEARSKENGIVFYSKIFPSIGSETFFDDDGNMKSRLISTQLDEWFDISEVLNEKDATYRKRNLMIFNIFLIFFSIIAFVFSGNFGFVIASIFFSEFGSYDFYRFARISYEMKTKNGSKRSTSKFHAAEHMAINAYIKLQKIPTVEEVKTFSRFSKKCGSRKIISRIFYCSMISIAMAFLPYYNFLIYLIAVLLITEFTRVAEKNGWLAFLQVFITSKPSNKEIELAVEGLRQFEIMEEQLKKIEQDFIKMELTHDLPYSESEWRNKF